MKYSYLNVIYPLMLYLIFGLMNYTLTIIKHCYRRFKLSLLTKRLYMSTNIASLIDLAIAKDENSSNHRYIGTLILRIYRRYIGGYFGKKY